MSRQTLVRLLALPIAIAAVAACDASVTAPTASLSRINGRTAAIEGDTLGCKNGWSVLNGRYECNAE